MRIIIYLFLIGVGIFGLAVGIKPEYIKEIFWGILLPWLVVLTELFFIFKAKEKTPFIRIKVMISSFMSKMILFAIYLFTIFYFYAFAPLPFVISFLGSFIVFYTLKTVVFKSLFQS